MKRILTYREIGKLLGISHGTVQNIERRALAKLRAAMQGEHPPPDTRPYTCKTCGGEGHNGRTCSKERAA